MKETFQNPLVTVDVVIFTVRDSKLTVLLIERANEPFKGILALPGGFLKLPETTGMAAERILKDKAGVTNTFMEQLYTFDTPGRDPRGSVISVTYMALVDPDAVPITPESPSLQHPQLTPVSTLPKLAFDHKTIIDYGVQRLRSKIEYTNAVYSILPTHFTFSQLQETYEAILGRKLDKRNFRKKFLELGLIKATARKTSGGRQRPAELYTFKSRKPVELKKFF